MNLSLRSDRATLFASRIEAIRRFLATDGRGVRDEFLDRYCDLVAATFRVAISTITIVDDGYCRTYGSSGAAPFEVPRSTTLSALAATSDGVFAVADIDRYPDPSASVQTRALGGRFFAGAPLVSPSGERIGALTIIDPQPRAMSAHECERLLNFADFGMGLIAERLESIELRSELDDHRSTVMHAPNAIVSTDAAGRVVAWNAAAERLYGWSFDEAVAGDMLGVPPELRVATIELFQRLVETGVAVESETTVGIDRAGRRHDLVFSAAPKRDGFGQVIGVTYVIQDVSPERRRTELAHRRSTILELAAADAELETILEQLTHYVEFAVPDAHVALLLRDEAGATVPFTKRDAHDSVAAMAARIKAARIPFPKRLTRTGGYVLGEIELADAQLEAHGMLRSIGYDAGWAQTVADSRGAFLGAILVHHARQRALGSDETRAIGEAAAIAAIAIESYAGRMRLERLALHDALTGLPNRALLEQRLATVRAKALGGGGGFALAMLDLDRFKLVNDSLGHAVGDQLLVEVGNRIRASLRSADFVARLAGDEFLVVIEDAHDRATAARVAQKIVDALAPAFSPGGHELYVRASVGIALFPDDATEPSELLRRVDGAMYAAKSSGSTIGFVDANDDRASALQIETDLNRAIAGGQLVLHYQPCVDVAGGRMQYAEALLRWHHPRLGMLSPDRFIPIAEQTGLIVPIGAWVLGEACGFARRWRDAGGCGIVSVNVSARQFEDRGFVATVIQAVLASGIEPSQLWLEITETLIMRSPESAAATLAELRRFGVRSTIDDFGTGYSSLAYLKRFPIDGLKIDRAFVKDLGARGGGDDGDRAIVASIVALGKALGLAIVAEGAETVEQIDLLRHLGCSEVQGYFFARPMPEAKLMEWRPPELAYEAGRLRLVG